MALLAPALILAGGLQDLTRERPRPASPEAARLDAALRANPPEVILLGNSKAESDIDAKELARAAGIGGPVKVVNLAGSGAPAWYAMLDQRVYAKGYAPKLVIVYAPIGAILRTTVTPVERAGVEAELDQDSPLLDAKVLGPTGARERARERARGLHDELLGGIRDLAVGLIYARGQDGGLLAAGHAMAEPALEEAFGAKARFVVGHAGGVMPVAEAVVEGPMAATGGSPADSLVPDLVRLAREHGSAIAFVRAPLPAATANEDAVPPATDRALFELLQGQEASWIDLHAIQLPADGWRDSHHLSLAGRAELTAQLAAALTEGGVLEGRLARGRPPLVPSTLTRVGPEPVLTAQAPRPIPRVPCASFLPLPAQGFLADDALISLGLPAASPLILSDATGPLTPHQSLAHLGDTCTGAWTHRRAGATISGREGPLTDPPTLRLSPDPLVEGKDGDGLLWVYPGTRLVWTFDDPRPGETIPVRATIRTIDGEGATLRAAGAEARFERAGREWRATLQAPPAAGPWTVEVQADEGAWLVVNELTVGADPVQRIAGAAPADINLLANPLVAAAPPPPVAPSSATPTDGLTEILLPTLAQVSDDELKDRLQYPCSPVRVSAAGAAITAAHQAVTALKRGQPGFFHARSGLLLTAPSPTMPGPPYTLSLDPARTCAAGRWLYPGDSVSWRVGLPVAPRLHLGADQLVVTGLAMVPPGAADREAHVPVLIRSGEPNDPTVLTGELTLPGDGGRARVCIPFEGALKPGARFEVAMTNPDPSTWVLLWTASVTESEHTTECTR